MMCSLCICLANSVHICVHICSYVGAIGAIVNTDRVAQLMLLSKSLTN